MTKPAKKHKDKKKTYNKKKKKNDFSSLDFILIPLFPSMTMIASRSETWFTRRQWQWRFRFIRSEPLSSEFLWAGTSNAQRCGEKDLYFWNPYEDMFMMVQTFFQKWTEMKFVYSLLVFLKKKHSKIVI